MAVLGVFVFSFFRDPPRVIPGDEDVVVAPADGKIVEITRAEECPFLGGAAHKVAIFMSIFNAHVNRLPLSGTLVEKRVTPGKFLNALNPRSAVENENVVTVWERPDGTRFAVKQIAGVIARTVVCEPEPGELCERGRPFGMIKFGSRTELYLQAEIPFRPTVRENQAVRAGSTALGEVGA